MQRNQVKNRNVSLGDACKMSKIQLCKFDAMKSSVLKRSASSSSFLGLNSTAEV